MTVVIKTPARLHVGLLDMNGELGRLYGSIGVAIEYPNVVLEAERLGNSGRKDDLVVEGAEQERMMAYARRFLAHYPLAGSVRLRLRASIPAHVGLGSGTQLALAIGTALARLGDLELDARDMAPALGRGAHSGIGIAIFQQGGFVVDGGHPVNEARPTVPPVLFRQSFPSDWVFVVAVPATTLGLSGATEHRAFQTLPPAPAALVEKTCRLVLMKMLPALLERQIVPFGQALTEIERLVGDEFATAQGGGRYAGDVTGRLVDYLLGQGARGAGQSSWGPTVYALVEEDRAASLEAAAREFLDRHGGGQAFRVRAANRGARAT